MIDVDVRAEVRAARELAAAAVIDVALLDGVTWTADPERAVPLHPAWRAEPTLPEQVRETLRLRRSDLLAVAARCRERGEWAPLLAAANAWACGGSGHGRVRTRRMLGLVDLEPSLRAAIATLDADGPVHAYFLLNNEGHLHGWGPALFTRFLASADRRMAGRALGLDPVLARAVTALVAGSELGAADWSTAEYAYYLGLLHRIADQVGVSASVVEAVLAAKFAD